MAEVSPDNFGFLGGLLNAAKTGLAHSYGQLRDDFGSLLGGEYNPGTLGRLADVAQELPLGRGIQKLTGLINPSMMGVRSGKVFREASGAAPAVREMGGKFFTDAPQPHEAPWTEILRDLIAEGPIPRSTLRPAIKTPSGVISGDVAGGHGRLWESVSPAQRKGAIDGYIDRAGRFMTRDQGTIASGSIDSIRRSYQNALADY